MLGAQGVGGPLSGFSGQGSRQRGLASSSSGSSSNSNNRGRSRSLVMLAAGIACKTPAALCRRKRLDPARSMDPTHYGAINNNGWAGPSVYDPQLELAVLRSEVS